MAGLMEWGVEHVAPRAHEQVIAALRVLSSV